ncbi:MAG: hypothetical protein U9R00_03270 [Patescibacteria group bacterium]|nr:hypothetical protein [Patescibacteria group bacterium]
MKLIKRFEKNAKKMKWYDFSFFKLALIFFTLFLITVWSGFHDLVMKFEWYWYLIIFVIFAIPVYKKVLCGKKKTVKKTKKKK